MQHNVQNDAVIVGVDVMAVPAPPRRVKMNLDVAPDEVTLLVGEDAVAKVGAGTSAVPAWIDDPKASAVLGYQTVG